MSIQKSFSAAVGQDFKSFKKMNKYDIAALDKLTRRWQKRLNLRHWTIVVRYHRRAEHEVFGLCQPQPDTLEALITVMDPHDWVNPAFPLDVEEILVHELLHLWFLPVQPYGQCLEHTCFEQAIDTVSHSLVAAARGAAQKGTP